MALLQTDVGRVSGYRQAFNMGVQLGAPTAYDFLYDRATNSARSDTLFWSAQGGQFTAFNHYDRPRSVGRTEKTLTALLAPYGIMQSLHQYDNDDNLYDSLRDTKWAGAAVVSLDNRLVTDALEAGRPSGTLLGFDGQALFSTAHPDLLGEAGGTQSNVVTVSANTVAGIQTGMADAWARAVGFKDPQGNYINQSVSQALVMYPTAQASKMLEIAGSLGNIQATGNSDMLRATPTQWQFKLVPELDASTTDIYIRFMNNRGKPIQLRSKASKTGAPVAGGMTYGMESHGVPWVEDHVFHGRRVAVCGDWTGVIMLDVPA